MTVLRRRRVRQVALLAVCAAASLTGCATLFAHPLPAEAKTYRATTPDGWEISLVQYLPNGVPTGRPVLLAHGISANNRHMDLDEDHSLARWFAARGREAWTVSIRGTGESDRIAAEKGRKGGATFDTVWQNDTATAIRFVREHAQTPKLVAEARRSGHTLPLHVARLEGESFPLIDYVGHSMGGMLVYAYLSQGGDGIHSLVILGSPTRLDWGGPFEPAIEAVSRAALAADGVLPVEQLALLSAGWQGHLEGDVFQRLLYNPENVTAASWRRLLAIGTGDISSALWLQLVSMTSTGRFASVDGTIDYRRDMAKIQLPVLVVAGKVDRIGSPPAVKDGYRALGSARKEWVLAAEENGFAADYGHMDLIIGERAPTELWPRLLDFLGRHAQ